ncbi:Zinc finger protein, partial [Ophiophagus hannah]
MSSSYPYSPKEQRKRYAKLRKLWNSGNNSTQSLLKDEACNNSTLQKMPSEQEQFFCIQKTNLLQDDESDRLCVSTSDVTIEKSTFDPTISDIVAYGLKKSFNQHRRTHRSTLVKCEICNDDHRYTLLDLTKHFTSQHCVNDHLYAKDKMNTDDNEKRVKNSRGLKLILKRYKTGASRKALWKRKKITTDGCRTEEEDEQVFKALKESLPKSEEVGQSVKELHDILLNEKIVYSGAKSSPTIQYNRAEGGLGSTRGLMKKAVHGPTVLMVKNNKISVPANYSAKFLGFKTVDGKQHIVIKLLPTEKQNVPGGNKFDGIKDGTTECQEETAVNCNLPLVARSHEINNQMPRNNSVHLLTSPLSNQFSGKIKQEGNMMPANAYSANEKSKDSCSSVELVHLSRDGKTWSQKPPLDSTQKETTNKGSSFENQKATENMSTQMSKVRRHSKQNDAKVFNATVSQKNKNLKRKANNDFQGPPRKKTLHRKCKEKNQQLVKCPRRNQPVVVLNHPDADVPEVVNGLITVVSKCLKDVKQFTLCQLYNHRTALQCDDFKNTNSPVSVEFVGGLFFHLLERLSYIAGALWFLDFSSANRKVGSTAGTFVRYLVHDMQEEPPTTTKIVAGVPITLTRNILEASPIQHKKNNQFLAHHQSLLWWIGPIPNQISGKHLQDGTKEKKTLLSEPLSLQQGASPIMHRDGSIYRVPEWKNGWPSEWNWKE